MGKRAAGEGAVEELAAGDAAGGEEAAGEGVAEELAAGREAGGEEAAGEGVAEELAAGRAAAAGRGSLKSWLPGERQLEGGKRG